MLSQYSWWDLTKIVLVALILYYAYVLWTYYREDIRDWLSNRGQKPELQPETGDLVDDDEAESLYTVSKYTPPTTSMPAPIDTPSGHGSPGHGSPAAVAPPAPEPAPLPGNASTTPAPVPPPIAAAATESNEADLNLTGPAIPEENPAESDFALTMSGELERPEERPLSTFVNAANRLQATDDGKVVADDPADKEAQRVADVINQQQGRTALAGFAFTR